MKIFLALLVLVTIFIAGITPLAAQTPGGKYSDELAAPETIAVNAGDLIISEFRVRGPNGANDEFIEIYNASGANHTVAGGGTGYAIAASNGIARCVIPNGTIIPNRGHWLCVNSVGYSLSSYPSGNGTTATGDGTYTTDIPDNAGIALFNTSVAANFTLANRLDAVGSTSEANTLYKEGTGYPALTPFSIDYAFARDECGYGGLINNYGRCTAGAPRNTNNNVTDFVFMDTNGTSAGAGQRLGAPGPQNLSSPIRGASGLTVSNLDKCVGAANAPNRFRDFTSDSANHSTFGTLEIRRTITNNTGGNITRLKIRVTDLATFPSPSGEADLRPRTTTTTTATVSHNPCNTGGGTVNIQGTTLEQPPTQPNGGGYNSSMSAGTITLAAPLANGASVDLRFLFGIQQTGRYKVGFSIETLPGNGGGFFESNGSTENSFIPNADFDGDLKTDMSIYRPAAQSTWWLSSSATGSFNVASFGLASDKAAPADFTGDGIADVAIYRPSSGQWYVLRSEDGSFSADQFGTNGDIPMPADYDGDGLADTAVFRPSNGTWYIEKTTGGISITAFGSAGDVPVAADFDGDRKADIAVYRPSTGVWWILKSTDGTFVAQPFGIPTDKPVQGDYTGDGKADMAVYRPSTGSWYVLKSEDGSFYVVAFGLSTDVPAPGDFDGDGKFDQAVYRSGTWWVNKSTGGVSANNFGNPGDIPAPGAYVP
jgi:hypothetical protein